jgi:thioester reductase-like protein
MLTGATGLVGRFLMRDLLLRGQDLIVVARRRGPVSGFERIEAVLQDWEQKLGRRLIRPVVVEADIHAPGFGLSPSESQRLTRRCRTLLHCAASLRFEEDANGEEPLRTNLAGTRNVVEFASEAGIPHFHHVSTAYVCGQRKSPILESELDCDQAFHNIYEQSKFQAEQLVAAAGGFETKTVYRPSIIVGDFQSGFSSTFHTVYSILRFLRALPESHATNLDWIFHRLQLSGNERKNLVPVDWVTRVIAELLGKPESWNQTFHLTHDQPTRVDQISDAIAEAVEKEAEAWEAMAMPASLVDAQLAYVNHVEVYRGYLNDDPKFDRRNLEMHVNDFQPATLTHSSLVRLLAYAIRHRFRDETPALPRKLVKETFQPVLRSISEDAASHGGKTAELNSNSPLDWILRLTGPGGGEWEFQSSNRLGFKSCWVHTSVERWHRLIEGTLTVADAIASAKLVLGCPKECSPSLREQLNRLIEICRTEQNRIQAYLDQDLPTVVPFDRKREGRRHA